MSRGNIGFTLVVVNTRGNATRVALTPEGYAAALADSTGTGNGTEWFAHTGTDVRQNEFWIDFALKDTLAVYAEVTGKPVAEGVVDLVITHGEGGTTKIRVPKTVYTKIQRKIRYRVREASPEQIKETDAHGNVFWVNLLPGIRSVTAIPVETRHEMTLGRE